MKVLVKKVGSDEKTTFVSCRLPAWERKVETLTRCLSQRLTRDGNSSTLGLVRPRGSPRYVNDNEICEWQ